MGMGVGEGLEEGLLKRNMPKDKGRPGVSEANTMESRKLPKDGRLGRVSPVFRAP